ncbi:acyltransferase family protein [Bacteroidota bacterium]
MKPVHSHSGVLQVMHGRNLALDGLRGCAITCIMLYHFVRQFPNPKGGVDDFAYRVLSSGWIAVDLFFVISGFLITTSMVRGDRSGKRLCSLYIGQSARVLPLYYGLLFFACVLVPVVLTSVPEDLKRLIDVQGYFWLCVNNWLVAVEGSFNTLPAGYLWWLALYQQYFVIWTILFFVSRPNVAMAIAITIAVASVVVRVVWLSLGGSETSAYVMTPTHLDGLAAGTIVALAISRTKLRPTGTPFLGVLASICVVVIGSFFLWRGEFVFWDKPVTLLSPVLLTIISTYLLLKTIQSSSDSRFHKTLANPILASLGRHSLAIYLLHPIVGNALVKLGITPYAHPILDSLMLPTALFLLAATCLTWVAAVSSWYLYQVHFIKLGRLLTKALEE